MRRVHVIVLALSTCVVGVGLVRVAASSPEPKPALKAPEKADPIAPPPAVTTTVQAPVAPTAPPENTPADAPAQAGGAAVAADAPSSFAEAMASSDRFVRREAIEGAVERKDVSALPLIEKVDLTVDGYVAAAAVDAVGKLAALLPEGERAGSVRTLSKWLAQESRRDGPGAMGNASIAVDALADTKSQEAIGPLVAALDSAKLPLHMETKIVMALDRLGAKSAAGSVTKFADRVSAMNPTDDFERALAAEALATAKDVLSRW
jgi:HEAT repeat protein